MHRRGHSAGTVRDGIARFNSEVGNALRSDSPGAPRRPARADPPEAQPCRPGSRRAAVPGCGRMGSRTAANDRRYRARAQGARDSGWRARAQHHRAGKPRRQPEPRARNRPPPAARGPAGLRSKILGADDSRSHPAFRGRALARPYIYAVTGWNSGRIRQCGGSIPSCLLWLWQSPPAIVPLRRRRPGWAPSRSWPRPQQRAAAIRTLPPPPTVGLS